ncbi:hypothetical protein [Paenibacillus sp. HJGM_3]|uniref:hypothetical protein n=1 Tax=Paenibacillus sp. HJGM_3 TaxID=3379816 RepID=UPI00385BF7E0
MLRMNKLVSLVVAIVLCLTLFPVASYAALQPYHAPAETSGSITVKLHPTENVATGSNQLVTFGVPFPRGSVTAANLSKIRVLKNGVEIPAYVEQQTPWRHLTNAGIDGQSVRVARIQIHYTFSVSYPNYETITVEWGTTARSQNVTSFEEPRNGWHQVTSGTFVAADNVFEPNVYAVLPPEHLSKGMLRARMDPFVSGISDTRDNPTVMAATEHYPGYSEYDYSSKNFFYTIINEDDPGVSANNLNPYKSDYEPWLYDRSSAMYVLYMRSGSFKALREAVRATDFYKNHIRPDGSFDLNSFDPKYSYDESMAYTYWLTGDNNVLSKIPLIVSAYQNVATRWTPTLNMFTERHVGFKLLANVVAYEVLGDTAYKNKVTEIVGDFIWHQNGAGGQMPANRIDGGLYHTGKQHTEGSRNAYLASPWMSALLVDAMVRAYGVSEDPGTADFIKRMGNMVKAASRSDSAHQYDTYSGALMYPDYLMKADGTKDMRSNSDVQHAIDVGSIAAWAYYFSLVQGTPDTTLKQLANDLYFTFDIGVNYWTRPTAPASGNTAFRVSPPRKYGWEYRTSGSFSWLVTQ